MTDNQRNSTNKSGPSTSAGAWALHMSGLVMGKGGKNEVKEFAAKGDSQTRGQGQRYANREMILMFPIAHTKTVEEGL